MTAERLAQILAVLCLVIAAVMAGKPSFTNASQPVRGIADPGIALQTVRGIDEIDAILSDAPSADREVMRIKQYIDFAFIAAYAAIGVVIAWAMRRRQRWVALGIMAFTLGAAVFDVAENLAILRLLPLPVSETTRAAIQAIRAASLVKWSLASGALILLAVLFLKARRWYPRVLAILNGAAGVLMCWGVYHNEWLPWAAILLSLGLPLSAGTLKLLTHESAS
ncbi:MAG: hypothetical protein EXQ47_07935 [Bryobacterales bacterium]|nr:hypothetical protein [Bryobacterales bacterium]